MRQTCILEIIVPLRDEETCISEFLQYAKEIQKYFQGRVSFSFINDHSTDTTIEIIKEQNFGFKTVNLESSHGVLGAFKLGAELSLAEWCLLLPVDCRIQIEDLNPIVIYLTNSKTYLGGFFAKQYISKSWILKSYSYMQDRMLSNRKILAVWTNGLYFSRSFLTTLSEDEFPSFLQDVYLFKKFKSLGHEFIYHPQKMYVSARKYQKDGEVQRIWQNLLILVLYFTGYSQIDKLKEFYRTKKIRNLF
ncbi:MAG: glycosyltransferase [Bacteriovoracaceae bacterium]|nr:glycosyltransferase [Bacteriovoracaceae bacterium]